MATESPKDPAGETTLGSAMRGAKATRDLANAYIDKTTGWLTRDGTVEAAFRQGIGELGDALRAFPDSIQREEMGTIWHPTPGEIASAREPGNGSSSRDPLAGGLEARTSRSPGEIARDNTPHPQTRETALERSHELGHER